MFVLQEGYTIFVIVYFLHSLKMFAETPKFNIL